MASNFITVIFKDVYGNTKALDEPLHIAFTSS